MTKTNLSRRAFARLLAASGAATRLPAQAPSPAEELRAANQRRTDTAQTLARFDLPIAAEPATVFRA